MSLPTKKQSYKNWIFTKKSIEVFFSRENKSFVPFGCSLCEGACPHGDDPCDASVQIFGHLCHTLSPLNRLLCVISTNGGCWLANLIAFPDTWRCCADNNTGCHGTSKELVYLSPPIHDFVVYRFDRFSWPHEHRDWLNVFVSKIVLRNSVNIKAITRCYVCKKISKWGQITPKMKCHCRLIFQTNIFLVRFTIKFILSKAGI